MFRRPSKKQLLIRRIIVGVVMTISVLVIVTGTILFVLGYRLDSENGRLEQGALLQFDSTPAGAEVAIDGNQTSVRTPAKRSLLAGTHSFLVSKAGYQPWTKSLDLTAGTLTWLDYIRLVPINLQNETVASYASLYGEKASPDLRTLIVQEKADIPTFQLVDLRSQEIKTSVLAIPESVYSDATTAGVAHIFTLDQWDGGGRYVLVQHQFGDQIEWLVLDTQDVGRTVNVSRLLSINVSNLRFASTNGSILFGIVDGLIRKLDLSSATISRGLVSNVESFDMYGTSVLTYVGRDGETTNKRVVGLYRDGDESAHILHVASDGDAALYIDTTRYFSDDYVAIAEGLQITILKGAYPTSSQAEANSLEPFASFSVAAPIDAVSFSPEGDYLFIQTGLSFTGYELEHKRQTSAAGVGSGATTAPLLRWLDDAYVWAIYNSSLVIREFDGANTHTIGAATEGFDATLSQNGRYLYSVVKAGDAYHLQRVTMILN